MRQRKSLSYSVRKRLWLVGFLLLIDLALPKNGSMRLHEPDRATAAMMIALDPAPKICDRVGEIL